ncbi:hypothetical protein SASPL_100004 [Salvia splendens]|uniref:RRM domain-containing protein n=1 Tax=Salvia splendens TaxID=180675 RepID=A0A8X8YRY8_SALSN|nr:hypothetical protein SASPL_100004 [Salvia splendens]
MEKNGGERSADHCTPAPPFPADGGYYHYEERQDQFHGSHQHQDQSDHRHHQNLNGQLNESTGFHLSGDSKHSLPLSGKKRPIPHSNSVDYNGFVKLYVVGIPKTATELDVSAVFGEFGDIIEVVLLKDKRTGLQQGMDQ